MPAIKNMDNLKASAKYIILALLSLILLTASFYSNIFEVAEMSQFRNWESNSEAFIIGRLIKSRQSGLRSDYGFLQRDNDWKEVNNYLEGNHTENFFVYESQIGLHGLAYGITDRLVSLAPQDTLKLFYFINSVLLASLISMIALWSGKEFNLLSGVFVAIGCLYSNWLVFAAKNLYYVLWTMLLPFVAILYIQWLEQKIKVSQWIYFAVAFAVVFIRVACGFEFTTTILVSLEIPVIYYAIKERWDKKRYVYRSVFIGLGGVGAFFTALCINFWQRTVYNGDFNTAWENVIYNISKRTGIFNVEVATVYQRSLDQPLLKVINAYLRDGIPLLLDFRMAELFLIIIILTAGLLVSKDYAPSIFENRDRLIPLAVTTGISLAAPLSWLVIAKGHSHIHKPINYILWYIPAVLLFSALCGGIVSCALKDIWARHRRILSRCIIVAGVSLVFIWPVYRYYQSWDWGPNIRQFEQAHSNGVVLHSDEYAEIHYYDNSLFYVINKKADVFDGFYLHITPINQDKLPANRKEHGFENRDFTFSKERVRMPFWKGFYAAKINLPNYDIEAISTGQFNSTGVLWGSSLSLTD